MTITDHDLEHIAEDIDEVTRQIWQSVLGIDALPVRPDGGEFSVTGSVQIVGEWAGAVSVRMTSDTAVLIAGTMFECPPDSLEQDEIDDAVGEMANMIGGNVKALLPGPSQLSLPTVMVGIEPPYFPGTVLLEHRQYAVDGAPFSVSVLGAGQGDHAAGASGDHTAGVES